MLSCSNLTLSIFSLCLSALECVNLLVMDCLFLGETSKQSLHISVPFIRTPGISQDKQLFLTEKLIIYLFEHMLSEYIHKHTLGQSLIYV